MIGGDGFAMFEERMLVAVVALERDDKKKFDPSIIIALLTALIPLIQGCFKPKAATLRRRLGNLSRVAVAYRQTRPELSWREARELARVTFDEADKAKDEELEAFIRDCCE